MVSSHSFNRLIVLGVAAGLAVGATGCSFRQWWGETPLRPGVVEMPASQGECQPLDQIVKGGDAESSATFECWANTLGGLWVKVVGREKDTLYSDEINVLIRKGILTLGGEMESDQRRLRAIRNLFGLKSTLRKVDVDAWLELLRQQRGNIRRLYNKYTASSEGRAKIHYADVRLAASVVAPILKNMNWSMSIDELEQTVLAALDVRDPDVRKGVRPALSLSINALNTVCPTFSRKDVWNTSELGKCLTTVFDYFQQGAAWFEFIFDPAGNSSPIRIEAARTGMLAVSKGIEKWFTRPELASFDFGRAMDLGRSMGVNPPERLEKALGILTRFNPQSNGKFLHPSFFVRGYRLLKRFQLELMDSLGTFSGIHARGGCANPEAKDWLSCVLPNREAIRGEVKQVDRALRAKNPHFGNAAAPFDGRRFSWILFFDSVAAELIDVFAETDSSGHKKSVIRANLGDDSDELMQLISGGVDAYETVQGFVVNIQRKRQGLPFIDQTVGQTLRTLNPRGLARLATMTNDLLVQRTLEESNILKNALSLVTNIAPKTPMYLDQLGLTAVLNLVDSLGGYKTSYLRRLSVIDSRTMTVLANEEKMDDAVDYLVPRGSFRAALPHMLAENFPRTYESCMRFGYEISCAIAFDQVISDVEQYPGLVHLGDLDAVTVLAVGMEGLIDSCDKSGDSRLSWGLLNGNDELDCGYTHAKDAVQHLIDAGIISTSKSEKVWINTLLEFVNSTFVTRAIGKAAMMRGTRSNILVNWPLFWLRKRATIGSMFGLIADIMDQDLVKRTKKELKKKRKAEQANDPDAADLPDPDLDGKSWDPGTIPEGIPPELLYP